MGYVKLHDARHTFASPLIAAGEDPKRIQSYLGHSSITVTFDIAGTFSREASRSPPSAWMPTSNEPIPRAKHWRP